MLILFPHSPKTPLIVDAEFADEWNAARAVGFATGFYVDHLVRSGDVVASLQILPETREPTALLLRGWMLPGEVYSTLFDALTNRGYKPQTTPDAYEEAHYLPLAYPHIQGQSPRSAWIVGDDVEAAWDIYKTFAGSNAIIKDWVKSAKNRWKDGCFLPANTPQEVFRATYRVFGEARGNLFNRGVVLREFVPIVEMGSDIRGLPIVEETRLFFWRGEILVLPDSSSPGPLDERARWEQIARRFKSPFVTVDVAHLTGGSWKVVEVGDGGVSGLPTGLDPMQFYTNLRESTKIE